MRIAGIDPDTKSITLVDLYRHKDDFVRLEAKGRRAEDRIETLAQMLEESTQLEVFLGPLNWLYVETPVMGVNAKALRDQAMVVGMIRFHLWRHDIGHSLVDNGTWKKAVLGSGKASKEEIADYAQKVLGIDAGHPQDVYDAALIAQFGRQQHA